MRKIFILLMITAGLIMLPLMVFAESEQPATEVPPVAQPLIREGDFAVKLVSVLKIGTAKDETEAETMLSSSGVSPKNGWIADYPVTPIIIGELQGAIGNAADSKRLPMGKEEALKVFQNFTAGVGLSIVADTSGSYPGPMNYGDYPDPTAINNYYYDEGPPVVSYYPPPWDYYYMYAWVPYPFWWGGFFFSGFFCLHDFHRVVFVGGHGVFVSNHVVDPVSRQVFRVDANGRRAGGSFKTGNISSNRGFNSSEARNGAASIFNRGIERSRSSNMNTTAGKESIHGTIGSPGTRGRSEGKVFTSPGNNTQSFTGRPNSLSQSSGRSFSAPNRSSSGSSSESGSFSCTNCHGSSSSFGSSNGSSSMGFSGGSHGGGSGGSHGGGGGHR
jgi:hypothetical protein